MANKVSLAKGFLKLALPVLALLAIGLRWQASSAAAVQTREVRVVNTSGVTGQSVTASIELVAQGNENALGFSLNFNSAVFSNPVVALGSGAAGASLNSNTAQAASGRIGIALAMPTGQTFAAGTRQIVTVTFAVAGNAAAGPASITFGDQPISREVSDANANVLAATFTAGTITIQQPNPVPAITSINPNSATAGGAAFTLTVNGTGFVSASTVWWNGGQRATQFVSATQVTAAITAADIASSGAANVVVQNPSPGGGSSPASTFTISQPPTAQIVIDPVSPTTNDDITIRLSGTWPDSCVPQNPQLTVNGNELRIDTTNPGQVCATVITQWTLNVPAGKRAAGNYTVRVVHTANSVVRELGTRAFTVNNSVPAITSLSPNSATAGGAAFTLTVNGANFTNSSTVNWNGAARTTQFVSATRLTAAISATDIAVAGTASVTVITPAPGGGTSNPQTFTINSPVASVSAASFLGAELAPESIVAAFGVNLATTVAIADTTPLPTTLAGTKVSVKDSAGTERLALLLFVAPSQVNYQMPQGTANGAATITITSGDGKVSIGAQQISAVAPGLFTANASGEGVPAANVFRLKANGEQSTELLSRFDATVGRSVPIPIDLGPAGEQVFGIFFGTGFRSVSLANVTAKIGGINCEVLYAGLTPGFIGLDQFNIRLDRGLIGRGDVDVIITVSGKVANTVRINIK